jgi:hypothetical protein
VNYELTCHGFAKALKEITDEISSVEKNAIMEQDLRTHALACDIYAQFFVFYRDVLHWFSARSVVRAFRSFNQDLYSDLRESVIDVQRIAGLITRQDLFRHGEIQIDMQKATHRGLLTLQQLSILMVRQNRLLLDENMGIYRGFQVLAKMLAIMVCEDRGTVEFWRKFALLKQQSGFVSELTDLEITTQDCSEAENNLQVEQVHPVECDRQVVEQRSKQPCPTRLRKWS